LSAGRGLPVAESAPPLRKEKKNNQEITNFASPSRKRLSTNWAYSQKP